MKITLNKSALALVAGAGLLMAQTGSASVDAAKAAQLGKSLTPLGGEMAGNGGAIPAYTGGITKPPAGYKVGMFHPDPFANDKVAFSITPANFSKYADQLSPGQEAMFGKYKTFKMNVYPTRRSASALRVRGRGATRPAPLRPRRSRRRARSGSRDPDCA